jgi:hypothetical protein
MFLSLPTELRLEIYEYLVPNHLVPFVNTHKHLLRHDEEPCCPAILCASRQIYNEIINMWYGTAKFSIQITPIGISFLGVTINSQDAKLPVNFLLVRSFKIFLVLGWYTAQYLDGPSLKPWTKVFINWLSPGPSRLTRVTLSRVEFTPSPRAWALNSYLADGGERFKAVLWWQLRPLRIMRGIHMQFDDIEPFWVSLSHRRVWLMTGHPKSVTKQVGKKMERIRSFYLEYLAKKVSQDAEVSS